MRFKESLGIEDTSWMGIGRHLSRVVTDSLKEQEKSSDDLQRLLISKGFPDIKLDYIESYLQGNCSFGCFFHHIRDWLKIPASSIFKNSRQEFNQQDLSGLEAYLGEFSLESVDHLSIYPRGEALRRHIATYLIQKYKEPGQNLCYVMTLEGSPLGYTELKEAALAKIRAEEDETDFTEFFLDNCNLRIFPYKNSSYTAHFVPKPEVMDLIMEEEGINLEVWRDIYKNRSFSKLENSGQLFKIYLCLGEGNPDDLVPQKNLSEPEQYEIFCRLGLYNKAQRGELMQPSCMTLSSAGCEPSQTEDRSIYEIYKLHAFMAVHKLITNNLLELLK